MKWLTIIMIPVTLGTLILAGYSFYFYTLSPCDRPLEYTIGRFDSQFGVSAEEFKARIAEAENVWEKILGKDIFQYDPEANFKINLIYDQRQLETMQKQKTESGLTAAENVLHGLDAKLDTLKASYESQVATHEIAVANFEARREAYESLVNEWNAKGGAPPPVYESLQNEASILNTEAERLNQEAGVLNAKARQLNLLLEERNKAALSYNQVAQSYNQKYGHGLEFNQAEYTGSAINIYQFGDRGELLQALAHELGHALGMDHVETPGSIMYYLSSSKDNAAIPSADDLAELKEVCRIE